MILVKLRHSFHPPISRRPLSRALDLLKSTTTTESSDTLFLLHLSNIRNSVQTHDGPSMTSSLNPQTTATILPFCTRAQTLATHLTPRTLSLSPIVPLTMVVIVDALFGWSPADL